MSLERVKEYFRQFGMENRIREFSASTETVGLAALAIGCEPGRIAKTMAFFVGDRPILIAAAGDAKISNAKFREQFHAKAKMIPFELVEQAVGHKVGGVCPFAVNEGTDVYLDLSLRRFESVFPAAGSENSAIELTIAELERYAARSGGWTSARTKNKSRFVQTARNESTNEKRRAERRNRPPRRFPN